MLRYNALMRIRLFFSALFLFIAFAAPFVHAQVTDNSDPTIPQQNIAQQTENPYAAVEPGDTPTQTFYLAKVLDVANFYQKEVGPAHQQLWSEDVKLLFLNGDLKGQQMTITNSAVQGISSNPQVRAGQYVVVGKNAVSGDGEYTILEVYRLYIVIALATIFVLLVILFGRWRGLTSLIALLFSIGLLAFFVIPQIIAGHSPLTITIIAAILISCVSLFLAHGFNKRTLYAFGAMIVTLVLTLFLALYFVDKASLTGLGTQDAQFLVVGGISADHLKGLLLSGVIIGALGVLEDITTGQSSVVDELHKANPELDFKKLTSHALSVGREHIASLVHTLVLAYVGSSLLVFLLFAVNKNQPLWVLFNSQYVGEELARTLIGSIALVLAVPIATLIAAYFIAKNKNDTVED